MGINLWRPTLQFFLNYFKREEKLIAFNNCSNEVLAFALEQKTKLGKGKYLCGIKFSITSRHNRKFFQQLLMSLDYKTIGFLVRTWLLVREHIGLSELKTFCVLTDSCYGYVGFKLRSLSHLIIATTNFLPFFLQFFISVPYFLPPKYGRNRKEI